MKALATMGGGYSANLMRAGAILRMSAAELAAFLRHHPNPRVGASNLPPPPPPQTDIRLLLRAALQNNPPPPHLRALAADLTECVEDNGLLEIPPAWLAAQEPTRVEEAVAFLQSVAPPGAVARSAQESLLLQLAEKPPSAAREAAEFLVKNRLPWLLRKRFDKLPRRRLQTAAPALDSLRPPFSLGEGAPVAAACAPDVVFSLDRGLWRAAPAAGARIAAVALPASSVGGSYAEARAIVAAVRARNRWTARLAQFAADNQSAFLAGGKPADLRPLSLRRAAERLRVSPAFVSQVVANKRAVFAGGGFALKFLFPGEAAAKPAAAVRALIANMIQTEDPRSPRSDSQLCALLRRRGVAVGRRAACAHRVAAGFAAAHRRKRFAAAAPAQPAQTA